MLGYEAEQLLGRHWTELIHPELQDIARQADARYRQGESASYELALQHRDGARLSVLVAGRPILEGGDFAGLLAAFSDLTTIKQLQAQLIQSEKLAALGRLSASLAHEINNPLQALRSGLGLLLGGSYDEEKRRRYLQVANREVERLIAITERMLNYYRPAVEQREIADVGEILEDTLALASKKLQHSKVTTSRHLAQRLPLVEVVPDQIKQVFLNILLNALDAMPDGGKLTVRTGWDAHRLEVWISFSDTGQGIPVDEIPRVFEPFYTTKLKGTGLGLAISYSIVERHGGHIGVESEVGAGSTFTVFLPSVAVGPEIESQAGAQWNKPAS
jgi:two-component system NtrC family sensor kinase